LLAGDGLGTSPEAVISVGPVNRMLRFCCRFPADRQQAGLLRPSARIKSNSAPQGCGQNQKQFVTTGMRPESNAICAAPRFRFCPQGVGAMLAGDGLGTSPKAVISVGQVNRMFRFCCRFPADRQQAGLLRPAARIKSNSSPQRSGQNQKQFVATGMPPELNAICAAPRFRFCPQGVGALLAGDGLGTSPKAAISVGPVNRVLRFCCRFPTDRQQAGLLRPSARFKSNSSPQRSGQNQKQFGTTGMRPESKAIRHHRDAARIKSNSSPQGCVPNQMRFVPRRDSASARRA